ncbi:N-methyl-L-tryptophan oxidase [Halalkalibacter kiskunsagensis]|uniref:N-methyl-L-tryptophan oxidase n=1 Tax=Halalkalibacter kiskunsagensis TaxID=1548599 RepID=A0ABV6KCB1_9BACI
MKMKYDCIVVGAGSMGMAAGYYIAKQGKKVLLIDSQDPPHAFGSHHGETRIIRHAYGEGSGYVPLALRAQELWNELEQESGRNLFRQTGVLSVGESESVFMKELIKSAETFSLSLETLDKSQIENRWRGITVSSNYIGCYERNSGVLFPEACLKAYRELAIKHGAEVLPYTEAKHINLHANTVEVKSNKDTYYGECLVISGGACSKKILTNLGLNLPLQPVRKTFAWFDSNEDLYRSENYPAFAFDVPEGMYYGFPSFQGSGLKVGRHDGGLLVDPTNVNRDFSSFPEDEEDLRTFLATYMKKANGQLKQGKVCLYTKTPDEDFIIDYHPKHSNVVIAAGFSGHGFKFASAIGEMMSQMILNQKIKQDFSMFSMKRFKDIIIK